MDALELLKTWPGWANAGAETVLASPAWRLSVRFGEETGVLRLGVEALSDTIDLDITLDGEPHVLSLADSSLYPDLHVLWGTRAGLPPEILLALVEKECGDLFFMLEKSTRRMVGDWPQLPPSRRAGWMWGSLRVRFPSPLTCRRTFRHFGDGWRIWMSPTPKYVI